MAVTFPVFEIVRKVIKMRPSDFKFHHVHPQMSMAEMQRSHRHLTVTVSSSPLLMHHIWMSNSLALPFLCPFCFNLGFAGTFLFLDHYLFNGVNFNRDKEKLISNSIFTPRYIVFHPYCWSSEYYGLNSCVRCPAVLLLDGTDENKLPSHHQPQHWLPWMELLGLYKSYFHCFQSFFQPWLNILVAFREDKLHL